MTDIKHSYAQTGTGPHKIGVAIDLFATPKTPPKPTKATMDSNRLKVGTPRIKLKPSPQYNIDIKAMQSNIDKLTREDSKKGMTPQDLYFKAHSGLMQQPVDYTDPRSWYHSPSSKKMMRKLKKNQEESKKSTKSLDKNAKLNDNIGKVSFLVTFPSLTNKAGSTKSADHRNVAQNESESSDRLPHISYSQSATNVSNPDPKNQLPVREKTQVQIRSFSLNIDESQSLASSRKKMEDFGSTDSLDSIGKRNKAGKRVNGRYVMDVNSHSPNYIETPPSALDRELTKSMENILKSVTGSENIHRSLKQASQTSIKFPQLHNQGAEEEPETEDHVQKVDAASEGDFPFEESRATSVNWQTGIGMRKTYSYHGLNEYSKPMNTYNENELSTMLVKVASQESLVKSRDKFKKLRIPQQRAKVEEITSFRNTYNLRQKSVLKLKMRDGFDEDKVPMNKIHVSQGQGYLAEYISVPSKLAPYIEGKVAQQFIVVPDLKGDINPQQLVSPQEKSQHSDPAMKNRMECPDTGFSHIPIDNSSRVNTLKTHSVADEYEIRLEPENKPERSRSRSRNRKKGVLSRGSTISNASRSTSRDRSKSRDRRKKDGEQTPRSKSKDDGGPYPSARSPSSTKVMLKPIPKQRQSEPTSHIPPPSQKALSKSYIPPKLRKSKHHYADSLDTLIQQHGTTSRSVLVGLALNNKAVKKRKKQLIRAFDKYLLTKVKEKLARTEGSDGDVENEKIQFAMNALLHPSPEPGKRPVFRKMKTLIPFDERGRPITQGKDKPVINEEFPNRIFKPSMHPQEYKLDTRQYPSKHNPLAREFTFDKRSGTIVDHSLDRGVTIGELSFPDKIPTARSEYTRSEYGSTVSSLTIHNNNSVYNYPRKRANNKRHLRHMGGGKDADTKKGERFMTDSEMDSRFDSSAKDSDMASRNADTPVDSITASMMKEIYENLNDYLEESQQDQGTQFNPPPEAAAPKELLMEG